MRRTITKSFLAGFAVALVALAACGPLEAERQEPSTPTGTATPGATATPSPTPSVTPTPTATAPPAVVSGDLRSLSLSDPVRQSGAPCGFVDTLDFPLDPPDGAAASGGGDFARFRQRYDAYHAGEDWRVGRPSFGEPVYSIGHGRVTYAQPLGWGADKGVVIVEHTFRGGGRVLSFYGHLDPPSVVLRAGQCVERGDQIGAVGDPRSSPHLHFEIRVHLADTPGPGYWPIDPQLAGWRPPSATIWLERIAVLPGVHWTELNDDSTLRPVGLVGEQLVLFSVGQLLALDRADGRRAWAQPLPESVDRAALDGGGELIYLAGGAGIVEAFKVSELGRGQAESDLEPFWQFELGSAGSFDLIPLPGRGVVAASRLGMTAISGSGTALWSAEMTSGITDWAHSGESLVLAARDGVWVVDASGAARWSDRVRGERVVASAHPYVYAEDGIYRLDMRSQEVELFFGLPSGFPRLGDLVDLPDGGLLVAHRDLGDSRLIAVDGDGTLRWERSIQALEARAVELLELGGQAYLLVENDIGRSTGIDIFHIDEHDGALLRVFSGGSWSGQSGVVAFAVSDDSLLIGIAGVGLAAWSPGLALEALRGQ